MGAKFVYVFDPDEREGRTWDNAGAVEDVATGSAVSPATSFLAAHRLAAEDEAIVVNRGRFLGRPSVIALTPYGRGDLGWADRSRLSPAASWTCRRISSKRPTWPTSSPRYWAPKVSESADGSRQTAGRRLCVMTFSFMARFSPAGTPDRLPSRGRAASCAPLPILSCKRSMADRLRHRAKNLPASGRHVKTADAG